MSAQTHRSIRPAQPSDAEAIAQLLGELGYPTDAEAARERVGVLLARNDAGVIVYEVDGTAVALAAYQLMTLLERSEPQCRITALVVRADQRRSGLAHDLIDAIESLARARSCFRLEVTTQPQRTDALGFYVALGFQERPRRLVKPLA